MTDTADMPRVRLTVEVPGVEVTEYDFVRATVAEALAACELSLGNRPAAHETDRDRLARESRGRARVDFLRELRELMAKEGMRVITVPELNAMFDRHGL